jgi:hypothetical protein
MRLGDHPKSNRPVRCPGKCFRKDDRAFGHIFWASFAVLIVPKFVSKPTPLAIWIEFFCTFPFPFLSRTRSGISPPEPAVTIHSLYRKRDVHLIGRKQFHLCGSLALVHRCAFVVRG